MVGGTTRAPTSHIRRAQLSPRREPGGRYACAKPPGLRRGLNLESPPGLRRGLFEI